MKGDLARSRTRIALETLVAVPRDDMTEELMKNQVWHRAVAAAQDLYVEISRILEKETPGKKKSQ